MQAIAIFLFIKIMAEKLSNMGLFFDDLNKLRVTDNDASAHSSDLKDECRDFVDKITEYQTIAEDLIESAGILANQVEKEKVKALQKRNRLKCSSEQRAALQQQLQMQILEKRAELERMQAEIRALHRTEQEQQEMMQHVLQQ